MNETLVLILVFVSLNPDLMADWMEFPSVLDANPITLSRAAARDMLLVFAL